MRKCKYIIFIMALACVLLATACSNPYDKVKEEDEKTILFVMSISLINMVGNGSDTCLCIDNMGNIYKWRPDKKLAEVIESKEIFECEIVGQISTDEVIENYSNLRKIDEELFFYGRNEGGTEMERHIAYYGVRYIEGDIEIIRLGDDDYYSENQYAEDIVEWMNTWDWKSYL